MKIIDNDGIEIQIKDIKKVVIEKKEYIFVKLEEITFPEFEGISTKLQKMFPKNKIIVADEKVKIYKGEKII